MSPSNTQDQRRARSQSRSRSTPAASKSSAFTFFSWPRMPSVFKIVRVCVYVAVLLWTIVCLAIAAHFQSILMSSDLTRFVPFAIFVCCASLLIILALLGFSLWKERNPISTRVELGCLALAGTLWLALGAFVASSDSEMAEVECFSSSDPDSEPIELPGFNTETYHAQYRVLEAFSFFNMILIFGFFVLLLVLALRQTRMGTKHVWVLPCTMISWFGRTQPTGKLPAPVTTRSRSQSRRPTMDEKTKNSTYTRPDVRREDSRRAAALPPPPRGDLRRDDSQRTMVSMRREDSYKKVSDPRANVRREDSQRTVVGVRREDSRRGADVRRDDSRRAEVRREDSRRGRTDRGADVHRDDSRRTDRSTDVRREDSRRADRGGDVRRADSRRRGPSPTRNEVPTYVYWVPQKAPEPAHTKEQPPRPPARDSHFFPNSQPRR